MFLGVYGSVLCIARPECIQKRSQCVCDRTLAKCAAFPHTHEYLTDNTGFTVCLKEAAGRIGSGTRSTVELARVASRDYRMVQICTTPISAHPRATMMVILYPTKGALLMHGRINSMVLPLIFVGSCTRAGIHIAQPSLEMWTS